MSKTFRALISKTVVDRMQPGDTVWDTQLKGFGARRQTHSISYIMKAFADGRQRWITIGKHGQPWTPATARKRALELKINPDTVAREERKNLQLSDVVEEFRQEHFPKLRASTRDAYEIMLSTHILPALGDASLRGLKHRDVAQYHATKAHSPRSANFSLAVLSKLLAWAEDNGYRDLNSNPCGRIKRFEETKRERFLSSDELHALGAAIETNEASGKISIYAAAALRLLVFTGCRLNEILTLEWQYVDLDRQCLFLPTSKTGKKTVTLNQQACTVLSDLPKVQSNPYVIVGRKNGAHLVNLSKPWQLVRTAAELNDVRIHDLRHSFASVAASEGASLQVIGKLLGHTQAATTARYAHLTDDALKRTAEGVGSSIDKAFRQQK